MEECQLLVLWEVQLKLLQHVIPTLVQTWSLLNMWL